MKKDENFSSPNKADSKILATLLEGAGLAFDIQKCFNFLKLIMVVLNNKGKM